MKRRQYEAATEQEQREKSSADREKNIIIEEKTTTTEGENDNKFFEFRDFELTFRSYLLPFRAEATKKRKLKGERG